MPKNFKVRFYSVEKMTPNGLSLRQALEQISTEANLAARQIQLTGGLVVRLERFAVDAGELEGEFTRVQSTNFPFEVHDDGVTPLQTDGPIGDGVAFRYRPNDHVLAMQYDARIVSPGRAMEYIMARDNRGAFDVRPKMDADNWRKFNQHPLRKLSIAIASPDHLGEVEDAGAAVAESFRTLGDAYDAPVISIEIGMGHRKGSLAETAKVVAQQFHRLLGSNDADVRTLKAKVKTREDEPAEDINLIDEVFSEKFSIDFPVNDPERNYQIRRDFLKDRLSNYGG